MLITIPRHNEAVAATASKEEAARLTGYLEKAGLQKVSVTFFPTSVPKDKGKLKVMASLQGSKSNATIITTLSEGSGSNYNLVGRTEVKLSTPEVEGSWKRVSKLPVDGVTLPNWAKGIKKFLEEQGAKKPRAQPGGGATPANFAPKASAAVQKQIKQLEQERDNLVKGYNDRIQKLRKAAAAS